MLGLNITSTPVIFSALGGGVCGELVALLCWEEEEEEVVWCESSWEADDGFHSLH